MNFKNQIIIKLAGLLNVNLLRTAYESRGILVSSNICKNGEEKFINKTLRNLLKDIKSPVLFDVGVNKGEYIDLLITTFPNASIHAFEPNTILYDDLTQKYSKNINIILNSVGLSSRRQEKDLFVYKRNTKTGHGTIYNKVLEDLHLEKDIIKTTINLVTLNEYCIKNKIQNIDFIKIDVEGHEFEVLKGGYEMINKIKIIQFEFNEMNVISRVFLKDFYELLRGFKFYRITPKGLFKLGNYSSNYEIFKIQNIIAINGDYFQFEPIK